MTSTEFTATSQQNKQTKQVKKEDKKTRNKTSSN